MHFLPYSLPSHLPAHLTISFPIWGLIDTAPDGAYHDLDRMAAEHVERGFNCIRLEGGAGLSFDCKGSPRGALRLEPGFGPHSAYLRQNECTGNGGHGRCDFLERLLALAAAAKRHGIYLILSSWYYLHTYWFLERQLNDELFAIPPPERFMAFARHLDFILAAIKERGLERTVAFAEIFNEADALPFVTDYGRRQCPDVEKAAFREAHEAALAFLRTRHPDILFAYDSFSAWTDPEQFPANAQVWNYHNYFLWNIYTEFEKSAAGRRALSDQPIPLEAIVASREGRRPTSDDWYERVWFYRNLDPSRIGAAEQWFHERLECDWQRYRRRFDESLDKAVAVASRHAPGCPVVCGEGVDYSGAKSLQWEEKSDRYWELIEYAVSRCRQAGMWGTVVRTCCGPEDPCWTLNADWLRRINAAFMEKK